MANQPDTSLLREIGKLQNDWIKLKTSNHMTKAAIIALVAPFRDKYHLKDVDALSIARNQVSLLKIAELLDNKE